MKTSNIMLLAALGLLLAGTTILLTLFETGEGTNYPNLSGNIVENEVVVLPFSELEAVGGICIYYSPDSVGKMMIKADSSLIDKLIIIEKDNKLHLSVKKNIKSRNCIQVYLSSPTIKKIKLSAGCIFEAKGSIEETNFDLRASSGANAFCIGNFGEAQIDLSSGAICSIEGKALKVKVNGTAGSIYNADNFTVEEYYISASAGSIFNIHTSGVLSVNANSGSIISYAGSPSIKDFNVSSGAMVSRK